MTKKFADKKDNDKDFDWVANIPFIIVWVLIVLAIVLAILKIWPWFIVLVIAFGGNLIAKLISGKPESNHRNGEAD